MAIIIMEMIGQKHGNRFYPTFSGVAQSYNYYPTSYIKRNDGVAYLALGLGKTVVDSNLQPVKISIHMMMALVIVFILIYLLYLVKVFEKNEREFK